MPCSACGKLNGVAFTPDPKLKWKSMNGVQSVCRKAGCPLFKRWPTKSEFELEYGPQKADQVTTQLPLVVTFQRAGGEILLLIKHQSSRGLEFNNGTNTFTSSSGVQIISHQYPELRLFNDPPSLFVLGASPWPADRPMPHHLFGETRAAQLNMIVAAIDEYNGAPGGATIL